MKSALTAAFLVGLGLVIASPGCRDEGVGDPCTPEQELLPSFRAFDEKEVNVESKSYQCRTRVCLVNHFRGRVSCPYGQDVTGGAPNGAQACAVPGTEAPVTGSNGDALVPPQCLDRTAALTVYCSCRCADVNGQQPSGQNFCDCPDGFSCSPLVSSIGQGNNEGLTGSYCVKKGTEYAQASACTKGDCNPLVDAQKCN